MDVFVIPVGPDRYEPYYEHATEADLEAEPDPESAGILAKLQRRFSEMLRTAEEQQQRPADSVDPSRSWMGRMQDLLLSWMAERVVEQRLLWSLRTKTTAVAVHPSDMPFEEVLERLRGEFQRDYERHRFWLVVDTIGMIVSWPLTLIPGPNVLLFYFMFRVGGHWFSLRGASRGRSGVTWTGRPCDALVELRSAVGPDGRPRQDRIYQIADSLHLRKLPAFFERMSRRKQ